MISFLQHTILGRVIAAIIMIILLTIGYWWLLLIAGCFFLFLYQVYYEIIIWGICFDALYASPQHTIFDYHVHLATILAIILLAGSLFLKKNLSFYT